MSKDGIAGGGIGLASLAAGPIFVAASAAADLYLRLPAPVVVDSQAVTLVTALLVPAMIVGAIISLPLNAIGAVAMLALGERIVAARAPLAWAIVGAACGAGIAAAFDPEPQIAFALVATSAGCGWLCSRGVAWPTA